MSQNKTPVQQLFSPEKEDSYREMLADSHEMFAIMVSQNILPFQELPEPYCLSDEEVRDKVGLYAKEAAEFVANRIKELSPRKGCGGGLKAATDCEMREELFKLIPQKSFPSHNENQIQTLIDDYGCATVWAIAKRLGRLYDLEKHHHDKDCCGLLFIARLLRNLIDSKELDEGAND